MVLDTDLRSARAGSNNLLLHSSPFVGPLWLLLFMVLPLLSFTSCSDGELDSNIDEPLYQSYRMFHGDSIAMIHYNEIILDDTIVLAYPIRQVSGNAVISARMISDDEALSDDVLRLRGVVLEKETEGRLFFLKIQILSKNIDHVKLLNEAVNIDDELWVFINDVYLTR